MLKRLLFAALAAALLGGCAPPPAPLPALKRGDVVLAFGDSLTHGTGASRGESYPAHLARIIGREVVSSGVPGEKSQGALRRFAAELRRVRPALVIVCTGGNDFLRKVDEQVTEDNIRQIAQIARRENIPLALIAVPRATPLSYLFPSNHPMFARIAADLGLWLEDESLKTILASPDMTSADTIHPNELGYLEMARAVAGVLKRAGAI